MKRVLILLVLATAIAHAAPKRVLVVDPDAELVHAIETSLKPWKLVVLADADKPVDPALVAMRATEADAQFVVWREGDELVVYDRERGVTERRPARVGAMDPVSAASAALTVKTMMRLPDPPAEEPAVATTVVVATPPAPDEADRFRVEAGVGVDTEAALRATFAATWRPTRYALRIGAGFELASQDVDRSGFKGSARDYAGIVIASWGIPIGNFELEPWLGAGVMVDVLDGKHGQEMRHETAVLPTLRAGLSAWRWFAGDWGLGVTASGNLTAGTPTYTREPGKAVFYDMPSVGGTIALFAAWRR